MLRSLIGVESGLGDGGGEVAMMRASDSLARLRDENGVTDVGPCPEGGMASAMFPSSFRRVHNCREQSFMKALDYSIGVIIPLFVGSMFLTQGGENSPNLAPHLAIQQTGNEIRVVFTGLLQSATNVVGPWQTIASAESPFLVDAASSERRFFRSQSEVDGIFSSDAVVELRFEGPFQAHFDLAFAGTPDGIIPPHREKPYFEGELKMGAWELPVRLRVRGNSSLQECPFPKLKFKVSSDDREGTPFFDAREVKIGTHCAEGGRGTVGRLRDETATFREALAYEILAELEFTGPRVRRARIEYRDSSPAREGSTTGWEFAREALILDDIEVVGERLGGRALSDEEVAALKDANFDAQLVANLELFHVLLGNWDHVLSTNGVGLWNTDVIELADGRLLPVAGDFDLASWVTGEVRGSAPHDYHPELGDVEREARYQVEQLRGRVPDTVFEAGRQLFEIHQPAIQSKVESALLDEPGRTNALRHVTSFYQALSVVP